MFATARFIRQRVGGQHWQSKVLAMIASYVGWMIITVGGLVPLGLVGGLMEGLMLVIILWITATASTIVYLIVWLLRNPDEATTN